MAARISDKSFVLAWYAHQEIERVKAHDAHVRCSRRKVGCACDEESGGGDEIRGGDSLNELKTAESRGNFQEVIHVYEARPRAFTGRLRQTFERGDEP